MILPIFWQPEALFILCNYQTWFFYLLFLGFIFSIKLLRDMHSFFQFHWKRVLIINGTSDFWHQFQNLHANKIFYQFLLKIASIVFLWIKISESNVLSGDMTCFLSDLMYLFVTKLPRWFHLLANAILC